MKKRMRVLGLVLAGALCASACAGCGSNNGSSSAGSTAAATNENFNKEGLPIAKNTITLNVLTTRWGSMGDTFTKKSVAGGS